MAIRETVIKRLFDELKIPDEGVSLQDRISLLAGRYMALKAAMEPAAKVAQVFGEVLEGGIVGRGREVDGSNSVEIAHPKWVELLESYKEYEKVVGKSNA